MVGLPPPPCFRGETTETWGVGHLVKQTSLGETHRSFSYRDGTHRRIAHVCLQYAEVAEQPITGETRR